MNTPRSLALCALFAWPLGTASAQSPLAHDQTRGFGADKLVTFTYEQNFACVHQREMDLNFNGIQAESDPAEMQTPICQVVTEPPQDPTGTDIEKTVHLYVLVPMFGSSTNPNDAMPCPNGGRRGELCGRELGKELIKLFGHVPEAWRAKPTVDTQCPDPNHAVPGTCTMHASSVDLSVLLAGLPGIPKVPKHPIFLPTPNHDHVVDDDEINTNNIWWEVRPVLVMDPRDWPAADGSSGITSSEKMDAAEAAGNAVEVGSNFFLFFNSKVASMSDMSGM
ncbi:MAG TPA: hypothetical protein VFS52_01900 [Steroidobacteraceae bacterium]|nr:hypothetical protein [Steroidobacteraceae bacterium]